MSDQPDGSGPTFLRRWSQRKLAAARATEAERPPGPAIAPPAPVASAAPDASAAPPAAAVADAPPAEPEAPALPDVASLTFESDFRAFLSPKVDEATQRAALRRLFSDARFNAMDGLDVYIDDYSKFEPIVPEVLKQLRHARYIFDPPKTRVSEAGHVEDVPEDDAALAAAERPEATSAQAPVASSPGDAAVVRGADDGDAATAGAEGAGEASALPGDAPAEPASATSGADDVLQRVPPKAESLR